jgi:alcohol dehydrogenase class IV
MFLCVPVHSKRAFIVTDPPLFEMGMVDRVLERLRAMGIAAKVFTDVEPDPTLGMVTKVRLLICQGFNLCCVVDT